MTKVKFFHNALAQFSCLVVLLLGSDMVLAQTTVKYNYDELGRLILVEDPINGNRDYQLDKAGNRVAVNVGTQSPTVVAPNGLACIQVAPGAYRASWNPVVGATSYVYRSKEERDYTITVPYQVTSYTCKWVQACTSPTNCSAKISF